MTQPRHDQLDGDLHSVTDDEFFAALDTAKRIAVYDENGDEVDVFGDVVDARAEKREIEAAGGTWTPTDFVAEGDR